MPVTSAQRLADTLNECQLDCKTPERAEESSDQSNREGGACQGKKESGRGRVLFELLDVALLDLLHEALTLEDVTTKIGGKLPRHHET